MWHHNISKIAKLFLKETMQDVISGSPSRNVHRNILVETVLGVLRPDACIDESDIRPELHHNLTPEATLDFLLILFLLRGPIDSFGTGQYLQQIILRKLGGNKYSAPRFLSVTL